MLNDLVKSVRCALAQNVLDVTSTCDIHDSPQCWLETAAAGGRSLPPDARRRRIIAAGHAPTAIHTHSGELDVNTLNSGRNERGTFGAQYSLARPQA
jgi:hypothetical protein